ncbi:PREDICTED: DNA repair protein RAD52 homolog [Eufriesea mexicana]|uniref:DNA repair protein RAD52 homolog n=1 Tax=Eufriesea mexicana TaxID=516756 RepID=UPI00083C27A9|nr:PREDICTED: DNA repair protein RAD52 homolog [Eufriesea mexicana]
MDNAVNYPSCIKIPSTNSKQNMTSTIYSQRFDLKEALTLNNNLILLANRIFGEGKWNHSVTNQTIDFIETFMGKYVCGCVTFVKIQLQNGTFHEDMGYCYTEANMKGLSIHCARIGSLTDAFKKVLSCFGNEIGTEIQKLSKKLLNSHVSNNQKKGSSLLNVPTEILEPCAQSVPFITCKSDEEKQKTDSILQPRSPVDQKEQISISEIITKSKSPSAQKEQSVSPKSTDTKNHLQLNSINHCKEHDKNQTDQNKKQVLTEENFLRMERKRKQMEKQAEYKRLMKEKEQKSVGNKQLNQK